MVHPVYTQSQLDRFTPKQLKAICVQLGITPAFRKDACIELILAHQSQAIEVVEPSTCATCPWFKSHNDGSKLGVCPLKDKVVNSQWKQTQDCRNCIQDEAEREVIRQAKLDAQIQAEGQRELEDYIEEQAQVVAPEPVTPIGYTAFIAESDNFFRVFSIYKGTQYFGRVSYSLTRHTWSHGKQHHSDNRRYSASDVIPALVAVIEREKATHQRCNELILSRFF